MSEKPTEETISSEPLKKPKITDEERLALAEKLDRELEEFIAGLEKKRYEDGWPEDRWQEEMDKHPFFMKKAPEPGEPLSPLMEGMQKLKYDPEENTAEELANNYKEDGNFYMKYKKFRMAIIAYTEGIKIKCENPDVNAILYNNRSAANYFLRNYRSSINDAKKALEFKPDYYKAKLRAATCCLELDRFEECFKLCDEMLINDPLNTHINDMMVECSSKKLLKQRNMRKLETIQRKQENKLNNLLQKIQERNVKFFETDDVMKLEEKYLIPLLPPLENHMVSIDDEGNLQWPAAFCYPEYELMEFQQQLNENATIFDCLVALLDGFQHDTMGRYKTDLVNVYHENKKTGTTVRLDVDKTIREIISHENFAVQQGTLVFYILVKGSPEEEIFLKQERKLFAKYAPFF